MIYLDYAANTPVDERVLEVFQNINRDCFGNPNGQYELGREAEKIIETASDEIRNCLDARGMEVIYTSGATEANNLALKGAARSCREKGRHIIATPLEHSSVSGTLSYLQSLGYEIDLVDITTDGQVNLEHLRELLRKDTVLVSVCWNDSELGVLQPIQEIREILKGYPDCLFHVDATQAVGKVLVSCQGIDMVTFAPHKFYGINGMGVLLKREEIVLEPIIHGGNSTSMYRSGTPVPAFAAAIGKALQLAVNELDKRQERVTEIKNILCEELQTYPLVRINSTNKSIPYFLNLSIKGVKSSLVQAELDKNEIYISPKSACSTPNTPSRAVLAVTRERKNAMHSWRISLSHLITDEEIEQFKKGFRDCYESLTKK